MPLVIVESPAKCSKIRSFLGSDYEVIASMGHIRALEEDLDAIGIDRNFEPRFAFLKDKSKAIQQIKEAGQKHKVVYLAADDDREGEAIAYSVCLLLKRDPATCPRAVFHEITKPAVTAAIQKPRTLDMQKVFAQQSRAVLDMLVGFTMSPLLWRSVGHGLSAGRCQTPALRLVSDREESIEKFASSSSWKVHGQWAHEDLTMEGYLTDELQDQESAQNYLEMRVGQPTATVLSQQIKPTTEVAPKPLITSSLQQQASTLFRSNPKNTMKIAQRLYEAGHITYMRTDQAVLGAEATQEGCDWIRANFGESYLGVSTKGKKATKAQAPTQDAHEAIRPTHMDRQELPQEEDWSTTDRKLYRLIWTRALQSLMAPCKGEQCTVEYRAEGDDEDWTWRSTLRRTLFEGWRKLHWKELNDTDTEETATTDRWASMTKIQPNSTLEWKQLNADPHFTKAPARFTEATLVKELEENGIGRPSTFASLISTILDKGYVAKKDYESRTESVQKLHLTPEDEAVQVADTVVKVGGEKDRLAPTPLGLSVLHYLLEHFNNLFAYEFTAQMEKRLDRIAEGAEPWKEVIQETWASYRSKYESEMKKPSSTKNVAKRMEFEEGIVAIQTAKGPLLLKESPDGDKEKTVFFGWPDGISFQEMTQEVASRFVVQQSQKKVGEVLGMVEGSPVYKKSGPYGFYAEWNGKKASCTPDATLEQVEALLKNSASAVLREIGTFQIRKGPYGIYMMKTNAGPKKQFVSVPETVNVQELTEAQCVAIFQHGIQNKARNATYAKGSGGSGARGTGARGRGGWRGRGRGRGGSSA